MPSSNIILTYKYKMGFEAFQTNRSLVPGSPTSGVNALSYYIQSHPRPWV